MSKFAFFSDGLNNQINKSAENELTTNIDDLKIQLTNLTAAHAITQLQLTETRQQVAELIRYISELTAEVPGTSF
jgi:ribosomal protein L29